MAWQAHIPGAFPNPNGASNEHPSYLPPPPPAFAEFLRFMVPGGAPGEGIDHLGHNPSPPQFPAGFPFGPRGPWGGRGGRGCRHRGGPHRRGGSGPGRQPGTPPGDDDDTPARDPQQDTPRASDPEEEGDDTMKDDPPEVPPEDGEPESPPPYGGPRGRHHHPHHPHHRGGHRHARGGRHGPFPDHGPHRGPHHHGPTPPPFPGGFDPSTMFQQFAHHPWAHNLREWLDAAGRGPRQADRESGEGSDSNFTPPLDIFENESGFVLHLALPGVKKEDINVNWNSDKSRLEITGIVHRPGDEEFQRGLVTSERRVGYFERFITLPPHGCESNDDVDGLGITAKVEDGILIIVVPKSEKEWTEVRKVDIE